MLCFFSNRVLWSRKINVKSSNFSDLYRAIKPCFICQNAKTSKLAYLREVSPAREYFKMCMLK